ncbi:Enoyl-[acyl-carrier-protein] reductase [NADPH, B-specific] 2, mitochondrial [Ancistrocladus abbreviatus]
MKTSNVLSVLINDAMDDSPKESGRFPLEVRSFSLHALIKDAGCVSRCLCADKGFDCAIEVDRTLPDQFQLYNSVVKNEAVRHMKETLASSSVKSLFR